MNNKDIFRRLFCPALAGWLMLGHMNSGHAQNYPNVTNFGANGDLLTLSSINTVSNSTALVCPGANFLPTDTNKLIEVFGGGFWRGISNEDLITYISTVSSPSNITVSEAAGVTANNLNGVYGTDDAAAFNAAIAACAIPTDTIIIPSGNYLLVSPALKTGTDLSSLSAYEPSSIAVNLPRGGITFAGQGNVILTGCGGWKDIKNYGARGQMFGWISSANMTNDYPLVFTNLTLDGGVAVGNIHNISFPVSGSTGIGWDGSHHWMIFGGGGFIVSSIVMQNCVIQHWRGEMMEMGTISPNNVLSATNCFFYDGDASCINNFAHNCDSCTFSNANQAEEFYRSFATNASVMANCQFYQMQAGIALNGGFYGDPTYTIVGNYFHSTCGNTLFTTPACDVLFISNTVHAAQGVSLGVAGYQDNVACVNSNIVMAWNIFSGAQYAFGVFGSGQNLSENVYFFSNQVNGAYGIGDSFGWSTNVFVFNNTSTGTGSLNQGQAQGQYFLDLNNQYTGEGLNSVNPTPNIFSYSQGSLGTMAYNGAGTPQTFALDDTQPLKIPKGATMVISNGTQEAYSFYTTAILKGATVSIPKGTTLTFYWQYWDNAWSTNPAPPPPTNVRLNF